MNLSIYYSFYLFICLCACLSIYEFIHLSVYLLSTYLYPLMFMDSLTLLASPHIISKSILPYQFLKGGGGKLYGTSPIF